MNPAARNRSRGVTLAEVMIAVAVAGSLALVIAALFRAGLTSYQFSIRQTFFLSGIRKALSGEGSQQGLNWAGMSAQAAGNLNPNDIQFLFSSVPAVDYYVSSNTLYRRQLSSAYPLAPNINSLSFDYYQLDGSGLIVASTAPESALLVTVAASMRGSVLEKNYSLFSAAQLRNHQ